jgi:predicted nucleic acid-binding protein
MFIACALAAKADCLVSGDKDLLVLDGRFGFGIVRPREFLARLGANV